MKNYRESGESMTVVAAAAVVSGTPAVVGDKIGIPCSSAAIGEEYELNLTGVYKLPKASADDIGQGKKVYWSTANSNVTLTSASNTLIGVAHAAAGVGTAEVLVNLNK